jgi:DNA primase
LLLQAQYYLDVGEAMLPHFVDRPLTLVRGMKGIKDKRIFVRKWMHACTPRAPHPPPPSHES